MRNVNWGWQGKARNLRMRGEYMFKNLPIPADIVFHVPNSDGIVEEIPAHKLILAMGSEVFYAMFYGPNAKPADTVVDIPNYKSDVFKIVIQFLYSDRAPDLTKFNAMDVVKCAEQYGIPELATQSRAIVRTELRDLKADFADHVLGTLEKAVETDDLEMMEMSKRCLVRYLVTILSRPSFLDVSQEMLHEIVSDSNVRLDPNEEILLYEAARSWAQRRQAEEVAGGQPTRLLREILGNTLNEIRFPLMSHIDIANGPLKDKIFTLDELSELYRHQFIPDQPTTLPYHITARSMPAVQIGVLSASSPDLNIGGVIIKPFSDGVSRTVEQFCHLFTENVVFDIVFDYGLKLDLPKEYEPAALTLLQRVPTVKENIPEEERQVYAHDSAGTVALRWVDVDGENDNKTQVGHYCLDFAIGDTVDAFSGSDYNGVVFGRIPLWQRADSWLKRLQARRTLMNPSTQFHDDVHFNSRVHWG